MLNDGRDKGNGQIVSREVNDEENIAILNQSLQKIVKGAGIVFIGTILGILFGFTGRITVARFFTQSEYGIFSLALVLLNITGVIASLGFQEGSTRQIAYYRGKKDTEKVNEFILLSIQIAFITSILLALSLYYISDYISIWIFHESRLSTTLKIFSIAVPFFVLINILVSIFRGFDNVKPKIYFQNMLGSGLFLLLLIPVVMLNLSFYVAMCSFSASFIITCVFFLFYTAKKSLFILKRKIYLFSPTGKELILFSMPLLATTMLNTIMGWTDTLMLGYFETSKTVGLYNGALPLARLIPIALTSMVFMYTPIISQFHSKNLLDEMRRSYLILTKWVFSTTLPILFIFVFFPDVLLNFLFGREYIDASKTLQLLSLGFFIHTLLGPNGATLTAIGETKILMWASLVSAVLNITLNFSLIPLLGITGAAIATASSLALANIILSVKLYFLSGIHPFTKKYLGPIITSGILISLIYFITKSFLVVQMLHLIPLFLVFIIIYGLSLLLTKSFEEEDISMLLTIEKILGLDMSLIKRILKRFV